MANQVQDAYIVAATRTPVGKARGVMRNVRPDDMLAHVLRAAADQVPSLDPKVIDDAIIGCAMPEAEQGMNVARMGVLLAGLPASVSGLTINRFCSSGVQAVAMAADRIRLGEAEAMIGGGTETMSMMPSMMGNKISYNPAIFEKQETVGMAYGMGLTAERVAERWQVNREDQDAFALASHQKAVAAINGGKFKDEISPYTVRTHSPDPKTGTVKIAEKVVDVDEGPRPDISPEALAKLRPVFAAKGSVTAGNASQMSDGATGAIRVATLVSAMQRDPKLKYGMVSMCIGTGMGFAAIFERV